MTATADIRISPALLERKGALPWVKHLRRFIASGKPYMAAGDGHNRMAAAEARAILRNGIHTVVNGGAAREARPPARAIALGDALRTYRIHRRGIDTRALAHRGNRRQRRYGIAALAESLRRNADNPLAIVCRDACRACASAMRLAEARGAALPHWDAGGYYYLDAEGRVTFP